MDFKKILASFGFISRDAEEEPEENEDPEISEEEEEEEESVGFFAKIKGFFVRDDDEEEEEEPEDEPQEQQEAPRQRRAAAERGESERRGEQRAAAGTYSAANGRTQVIRVINVREMKECGEIIKFMHDGEAVLINVERVDPKNCGRVVDLLSGAAFALDGRMIKAAHLAYLLVPKNVKAVEMDQIGGAPRYM